MKTKFLVLVSASVLILAGGGCSLRSSVKISKVQRLADIKSNASSVTPLAGPFANIKFSFFNPHEPGSELSMLDTASNTYKLSMYAGPHTNSSSPTMTALGEQKSMKEVLDKAPKGKIVYSHQFNNQVIDEARCFEGEKAYCERYLAIDPERSLTLTDYSQQEFYKLFSFELQPQKPAQKDWELYESKDFPYTFYRPKSWSALTHLSPPPRLIKLFYPNFHSSEEQPAVQLEEIKTADIVKFISERRASLHATSSTSEIVNTAPVTSFCYTLNQSKACEYYFVRPGQDTLRITDYSDQKIYKTLQFKHYYPYDPLQILE